MGLEAEADEAVHPSGEQDACDAWRRALQLSSAYELGSCVASVFVSSRPLCGPGLVGTPDGRMEAPTGPRKGNM